MIETDLRQSARSFSTSNTFHLTYLLDNDLEQSVSHFELTALELRHLGLRRGFGVLKRIDVVGDGVESRLMSAALLFLLQQPRLQRVEAEKWN